MRVVETIDVWYLARHGHGIAYGLSEDDLYRVAPSLRHDTEKVVTSETTRVGIAQGEVFDWSKHGGHSFKPKIHWPCPACGQQWFTDFNTSMGNPLFEASGCSCVPFWFVHWDRQQVENELAVSNQPPCIRAPAQLLEANNCRLPDGTMYDEAAFRERIPKLVAWVARDVISANDAALQYMDYLGSNPTVVAETYAQLSQSIKDCLVKIARSPDQEWYRRYFLIPGAWVERVRVSDTEVILVKCSDGELQETEIDSSHTVRVGLRVLRDHLKLHWPAT